MSSSRVCAIALLLLSACVDSEPDPDLGESEQSVAAPGGQGSHYQGSHYQGSHYQGSHYQGSHYQGSHYQGAMLGGVTLASGTELFQDRALSVWRVLRTFPPQHEQRLPDRVCTWDSSRTTLHGCTTVNLATSPSPLANVSFEAAFIRDGVTFEGRVRIANAVGAVAQDTSYAMHPMTGASAIRWPGQLMRTVCAFAPNGQDGCENPSGCRRNCDLFTYDLELVDPDGTVRSFCPEGERAYAVPGTYAANGEWTASTTQFTFACAGGTIAKCTWWGYRSFGHAKKTDGVLVALSDYHQSCVRAAAADYCASGFSFTKNGTLVDVYDYEGTTPGLVPRTRQHRSDDTKSAFVFESSFDRYGATQIDGLRFWEDTSMGTLEEKCPGWFSYSSTDDVAALWDRASGWGLGPQVKIDATTWCDHTERTVGKWLHPECSACVRAVAGSPGFGKCSDPSSPAGWDASCVQQANTVCTGIASHGECTTGGPLHKYDSGCTARVCSTPGYAHCCTSAWNSACVSLATATCAPYQAYGISRKFCPLILQPPANMNHL